MNSSHQLDGPYRLLKIAYGVVPIVAGLDKFTNLLTNWDQYLSPALGRVISPPVFMHVVGAIEIAAGGSLSPFPRSKLYLSSCNISAASFFV
jgi:hypothetical protein